MPFNNRRYRIRFLFPLVAIGLLLFLGWVVMRLWNAVLVPVLHVGTLNYEKALGLLVLCRILFGHFRTSPGRGFKDRAGWRNRWAAMSPEERMKFRQQWEDRCRAKKENKDV